MSQKIHVDQIGYRPGDSKEVMVVGKGGAFSIVDCATGKPVFSGVTGAPIFDASSRETVYRGDFTPLRIPGTYLVSVAGLGVSYPFRIADEVYVTSKDAVLKGLYYQRSGIALDEKFAGIWKRAANHLQKGRVFGTGETRDGSGGWHDAGDYGKYTVPGAVAVADLLLAYEFFPDAFSDDSDIPESGNGVPDILDEARYELAWLLKMQDASSGGVYHKLTTSCFPDLSLMPDKDLGALYFSPVSTAATADFAAVMAMAARVYSRVDQGFAAGCLKASEAAWSWLRKNPFRGGFKNPPGIRTGEYGDENVADEQYWAAAELYRTTGEEEYQDYVESVVAEGRTDLVELGWQSVGGFGSIAYMLTDKGKRDDAVARRIQARFLAFCDAHVGVMEKDGYRITLLPGEYCWGSNMTLLNDAMHLIIADRLAPNARYVEAARDDLHYLLGRNALNQSYLTGFGSNPVRNPHHRPSVADGVKDPVPGLVSGGPDEYLEDPYAKSNLQNLPPAKCFKDDSSTYSTNEVAIYWNTPAVFVMARFSAREGRECEETEDCEQTP